MNSSSHARTIASIPVSVFLFCTLLALLAMSATDSSAETNENQATEDLQIQQGPDDLLHDVAAEARAKRGRPVIDSSLGFNRLFSDKGTLMRGVSISWDSGDPYGSQDKFMPSQESLDALARDYGFNALHLYLEGDSSGNTDPVGYNAEWCDTLVERCAKANLYLIITIGCNGENGNIHSMEFILDFWKFYGPRYKDETHVFYEAKNEPVPHTAAHWLPKDWVNQILMYNTIREAAPDTMILLCSYMGFRYEGAAADAVKVLTHKGVEWDNAAIAWHGCETREGIEACLRLFRTSLDYPATLCTEFWPGDTVPDPSIEGDESYNAMFEANHTGWLQFQWLAANDAELPGLAYRLEKAGVVWTPDDPSCNWPAKGTPNIPQDGSPVAIFDRGREKFVCAPGGGDLTAKLDSYTGDQDDKFFVDRVEGGSDLVAFKASNGYYVSSATNADALTPVSPTVGPDEMFHWIEGPNGDVILRAVGGGGHLVRSIHRKVAELEQDRLVADLDNSGRLETNYVILDGSAAQKAPDEPAATVETLSGPGPYHGEPMAIPGVIEAVDFDHGGEGVAYHDNQEDNIDGFYRPRDGVDIQATSEGGCGVSWIHDGEWLNYTVYIKEAGRYMLTIRHAGGEGEIRIAFDGINGTGTLKTVPTANWQDWTDLTTEVTLKAGVQEMRVQCGGGYNLRRFTFVPLKH